MKERTGLGGQRALVTAQVFLALIAFEGAVAAFQETFLVAVIGIFPMEENVESQHTGGNGESVAQTQQRGTDHQIVPVIDPAGGAAAIVHHPGLEGTEEQNADDIHDAVQSGQTDHETVVHPADGMVA